jgi:hypothetical protein
MTRRESWRLDGMPSLSQMLETYFSIARLVITNLSAIDPSGGSDGGWMSLGSGSLDGSRKTVTSQEVCGRGPAV